MYLYSKTSLNRPTMGQTLNGPFREVDGLASYNDHLLNEFKSFAFISIKDLLTWIKVHSLYIIEIFTSKKYKIY